MAVEIEIKFRIGDFDALRQKLRSSGARCEGTELEVNTFLDRRSGELLKSGAGLRVRKATDLDTGEERVVITHKGRRIAGPAKIRPETEITVDGYASALALLENLGFDVILTFEKKRETWELGDCEVVLDELPKLGRFAEIEGPDIDAVMRVREQLGLSATEVEERGYAVLVREQLGDATHALRFS